MSLRVRNFDRYQYQLVNALKRTRIAFNIDAALLDPNFSGQGGYSRLGAWVRVIAWAARLDNQLPADTKWWRQEFGRHGDETRDKFVTLGWLEECDSQSNDSGADLGVDLGADLGADSKSPFTEPDYESKGSDSSTNDSQSEAPAEENTPPDFDFELEDTSLDLKSGSSRAVGDVGEWEAILADEKPAAFIDELEEFRRRKTG